MKIDYEKALRKLCEWIAELDDNCGSCPLKGKPHMLFSRTCGDFIFNWAIQGSEIEDEPEEATREEMLEYFQSKVDKQEPHYCMDCKWSEPAMFGDLLCSNTLYRDGQYHLSSFKNCAEANKDGLCEYWEGK